MCVCVCVRADGSRRMRSAVPMNMSQQMGPLSVGIGVKKRNAASRFRCHFSICGVEYVKQCREGVQSCLTATAIEGLSLYIHIADIIIIVSLYDNSVCRKIFRSRVKYNFLLY